MAERPKEIVISEVESGLMGVSTDRFGVDHGLHDLSMLERSCHCLRARVEDTYTTQCLPATSGVNTDTMAKVCITPHEPC